MNKLVLLLTSGLLSLSLFCAANDASKVRLAIGAGVIDLERNTQSTAVSLMIESRPLEPFCKVRPVLLAISSNDNSYYGGFGLLKELPLSGRWHLGLGIAAGGYKQGKRNRDLGYDLEFHSRIALNYKLNSQNLIRAELGHLSNAFLGDINPGTELITLNWVVALNPN